MKKHGVIHHEKYLIKVFVIPVANFLWFILWKTNFQNQSKPIYENQIELLQVFWKENIWFIKKRSMQLGLDTFLKHVFSFIRFFKSCWYRNESKQTSEISELKSRDNYTLSYFMLTICIKSFIQIFLIILIFLGWWMIPYMMIRTK